MAPPHFYEAPTPAAAADVFEAGMRAPLCRILGLLERHAARLDRTFKPILGRCVAGGRYGPDRRRAVLSITCGAAARLVTSGGSVEAFFEQVEYNSRRLAKLNVPPAAILHALEAYRDLAADLLPRQDAAEAETGLASLRHLHLCSVLTINNAFYQVREAETQAFFGLFQAELQPPGQDEILRGYVAVLARAFRSPSGRLVLLEPGFRPVREINRSLSRARYIESGGGKERLVLDRALRHRFASYWSVPLLRKGRLSGVLQFGFPVPYPWLPRELRLLEAAAERCLFAVEKARLIKDLETGREQIRRLASEMREVEENERRRISRELHDETGQSMLFLRMRLEQLEKTAPPDLRPALAEVRSVAEQSVVEVRRLIAALSPAALDRLGLAAAARQLIKRFREVCPARVRLRLDLPAERLPQDVENLTYRLLQESLQNAARHSRASAVNIRLRSTDRSLELAVRDNGSGFDRNGTPSPKSFGLTGMEQRVSLAGGRIEIRGTPGEGTAVTVSLPLACHPVRSHRSEQMGSHEQDSSSDH